MNDRPPSPSCPVVGCSSARPTTSGISRRPLAAPAPRAAASVPPAAAPLPMRRNPALKMGGACMVVSS